MQKTEQEMPDEEERTKFNENIQTQMNNKLLVFARSGQPGSRFKPLFERIMKNMNLPQHAK